jgi:raffinose/stachyose/melibiose transport system substrate-binding protein
MFLNGPWYIGRVKKDAPDVYANSALAPAPAVEGGSYGGEIVFALSNLAAGNAKNASKRAAVIEFLKWMTLPDNIRQISETSGSLFAVAYQADPAKIDPVQAQFIKEMNTAPFTISHLQMQMPTKVVAQFGQGLGGLALGQMTPQQFVDFMHQQLEQAK